MKLSSNGKLLRIFVDEQDKWKGQPLYEAIILLAKKEGMAGATALKGFMGFGAKSRLHTSKILRLSEDLPIVIEFVDSEENINSFLPYLDEMVQEGMITMENVNVVCYRAKS